jgi:hypothetical protein
MSIKEYTYRELGPEDEGIVRDALYYALYVLERLSPE